MGSPDTARGPGNPREYPAFDGNLFGFVLVAVLATHDDIGQCALKPFLQPQFDRLAVSAIRFLSSVLKVLVNLKYSI